MPLQNNGFQWRPNDNSSLTNLRYKLEAEKWVDAVGDAQNNVRLKIANVNGSINFITSLFAFLLCTILLVVQGLLMLIVKLLGSTATSRRDVITRKIYDDTPKGRLEYRKKLMILPTRDEYDTEEEFLDALGAHKSYVSGFPKFN